VRKAFQAFDPDGKAAKEIRDLTETAFRDAFRREVERRTGATVQEMRERVEMYEKSILPAKSVIAIWFRRILGSEKP
jgi:secreted Zn-dependent insulinase-like peptidase